MKSSVFIEHKKILYNKRNLKERFHYYSANFILMNFKPYHIPKLKQVWV